MGENVQGPSKPERSEWHLPTACAPIRATISWSLKLQEQISTTKRTFSEGRKGAVPHTAEDVPDMRSALAGVRETAVRGGIFGKTINTSWPPWDLGSSHLLDGSNTTKGPQVTVADPRELRLDLLQQGSCNMQAVIGIVDGLGLEAHGSIVAIHFAVLLELSYGGTRRVYSPSTGTGFLIVCSGRVPGKSKKHWAVGTVVVSRIASIIQNLGDPVVDLQVIYVSVNSTRDKHHSNKPFDSPPVWGRSWQQP